MNIEDTVRWATVVSACVTVPSFIVGVVLLIRYSRRYGGEQYLQALYASLAQQVQASVAADTRSGDHAAGTMNVPMMRRQIA